VKPCAGVAIFDLAEASGACYSIGLQAAAAESECICSAAGYCSRWLPWRSPKDGGIELGFLNKDGQIVCKSWRCGSVEPGGAGLLAV
jgi:hypothetical protein